jgi:hypothetical protein
VLFFALMGYSLYRFIQTFKNSRRIYKLRTDRFEQILENPKVIEAFEAAMNQAAVSEANKSHDEPRLFRALQKVRTHAKS